MNGIITISTTRDLNSIVECGTEINENDKVCPEVEPPRMPKPPL
jgi:hypothetical protein